MTGRSERYDDIGRTYARTRREDPRIAADIHACLGDGESVVNVGAGSGNYEPADRTVVAVEPSLQMIQQRATQRVPVVRATAESLPFPDHRFDVAMAILTVHHWADRDAGLGELRRASRRQVVFYFEPLATHQFWALDYFPTARNLPTERDPPDLALLSRHLNVIEVRPVLVPPDCSDGFGAAFWCRPDAYLDPEIQAGMSWLALLSEKERAEGTRRLAADLESGEWERRHGHLHELDSFDAGYRIAISEG